MQQDLLTPTQTPREAILFSAMLRLPAEVPFAEKAELVEKMLDDLGLMDCADTLIGDEMIRGISGGEKKRTSIGIELVMRPKLIFLDEPTSGLDAFAAHVIMKKVAGLAHSGGCNVLTTIHQPSSEVFHSFDKIMLLRKGEALFFGTPPQLSKGLAACGLACPGEFNLADHALFIVQSEADEKIAQLRTSLPTAASSTSLAADEGLASDSGHDVRTGMAVEQKASAGFTVQAVQLAKRELQGLWRNKPGFIATFLVPTVLNLFFALIFFQVGDTTLGTYETMSHFGGMTQIAIGGMFGSAQPLLLRFPLDRGIFLREYATSTYGAVPYFLSKSLVELPTLFVISCLVYLVSYWLMAFNGSWLIFVLVYWIAGLAAASTALLVGCLVPNAEVAQQAAPALFVPQLLFAGFFIRTAQIPEWLSWVQYLCGLKYGMNLFILNEFGEGTTAGWEEGPRKAAKAIVDNNDIDPDRWWVYLLILLVLICAFRLLAILALAKRAEAFF